jgi:hypothetical protein
MGCSSSTPTSNTKPNPATTVSQESKQRSTLPKDVSQSFYDDAMKITSKVYDEVNKGIPISDNDVKELKSFYDRHKNASSVENNIMDTINMLAVSNNKLISAKLQNNIVEKDKQSKEVEFQVIKLKEWNLLK